MAHELVRYMKSMNMHGEKIKVPVIFEPPCIYSISTFFGYSGWNETFNPAYQTVTHTEQQIPSVAKTQLFLTMMGP